MGGLDKKPRSCLVDGLQLSTGCTLGKGNIHLNGAKKIKIVFINRTNQKSISLSLKKGLLKNLDRDMSHKEAEAIAYKLSKTNPLKIVQILN